MKRLLTALAALSILSPSITLLHAGTAMETSMKKVAHACKQLGPDLKLTDDTKHDKATDLQSVATIKAEAANSRADVPKKAQALPADQQAAMTSDFQKAMDAFTTDVDTLNADITGDKWDAARTDFQKLMKDEHDDHSQFRVKK